MKLGTYLQFGAHFRLRMMLPNEFAMHGRCIPMHVEVEGTIAVVSMHGKSELLPFSAQHEVASPISHFAQVLKSRFAHFSVRCLQSLSSPTLQIHVEHVMLSPVRMFAVCIWTC